MAINLSSEISESDIATLEAAKKVLKRLAKRKNQFCALLDEIDTQGVQSKHYGSELKINEERWKFVENLHKIVNVDIDGNCIYLRS